MTHSAEWLRGAVWTLRRLKPEVWDEPQEALSMRDLRWCVDNDYQKAVKLLAAAEAREATQLTKAQWVERYGWQAVLDREGFDVVPCVNCGDSICHGWKVERKAKATQPTAAEVIRVAKAALEYCRGNVANHPDGHHKQFIRSEEMAEQALAGIAAWEVGNERK